MRLKKDWKYDTEEHNSRWLEDRDWQRMERWRKVKKKDTLN